MHTLNTSLNKQPKGVELACFMDLKFHGNVTAVNLHPDGRLYLLSNTCEVHSNVLSEVKSSAKAIGAIVEYDINVFHKGYEKGG